MKPFYSTNSDRPRAKAWRELVRSTIALWDVGDAEDLDLVIRELSADTGLSITTSKRNVHAVARLRQLPETFAHNEKHCLLDLPRLRAIDSALVGSDPKLMPEVDRLLCSYLTPSTPNEPLPTAQAIKRHVRQFVGTVGEVPAQRVEVSAKADGSARFSARLTPAEAQEAKAIVDSRVAATGETIGEAFLALLRGNNPPNVVLNLYKATDIENSPVYMHSVGWIEETAAKNILKRVTQTRNVDSARDASTNSYSTTLEQKAFLEGRDGTCRWPGCSVPAQHTQKDHRRNFAEGGPTHPSNMLCLCAHHHNVKTDQRMFYIMDPDTGNVVFLFADGTWATSTPQGPLSAKQRRWAQTIAENRRRRRPTR